MKITIAPLALLAASVLTSAPARAQENTPPPTAAQIAAVPATPIRPSKIILVGDSTMQMGSGWGARFCARRVSSIIACLNLARGGRSTTSYRREGSWDLALGEMSAPGYQKVYVLIQFGHNDQHRSAERYADPEVLYPDNLRRFIREARERGAIPIIVTPLVRRQFVDGVLQNDLAPWAEAARKVAAEMQAPLLDLNADSAAAVQAMGPFMAAQMAPVSPSGETAAALLTDTTRPSPPLTAPTTPTTTPTAPAPPTVPVPATQARNWAPARQVFDYTHLGETGAEFFSAMVARELAAAVPDLQRALYP